MTRIFNVVYEFTEFMDGTENDTYKEGKQVVAINATQAIEKVKSIVMKPYSFKDDETKKKVTITRKNFDPIEVFLSAEAE